MPLDRNKLRKLGLREVQSVLQNQVSHNVSFMIYRSMEAVVRRNQPFRRIPHK